MAHLPLAHQPDLCFLPNFEMPLALLVALIRNRQSPLAASHVMRSLHNQNRRAHSLSQTPAQICAAPSSGFLPLASSALVVFSHPAHSGHYSFLPLLGRSFHFQLGHLHHLCIVQHLAFLLQLFPPGPARFPILSCWRLGQRWQRCLKPSTSPHWSRPLEALQNSS